jgi:isopentenyl phosphate kinase
MQGVIALVAGKGDRFGHPGMNEISVISFPPAIYKTGFFQVSNQFSNLARHVVSPMVAVPSNA